MRFELAGGNAGVAEATNEAVEKAEKQMLGALFITIIVLCFLTFRSWKAVVCIMVPLTIVSIMCNGLMAVLGVGLKVATLPVVALGVGVGVDYGIYLFERIQHEMNENGSDLRTAIYEAMRQRGTAAVFTAVTMTIGVATAFSALKFQADMGILLAFMFLVNVLGAIFLAASHGLLAGKSAIKARRRKRSFVTCLTAQALRGAGRFFFALMQRKRDFFAHNAPSPCQKNIGAIAMSMDIRALAYLVAETTDVAAWKTMQSKLSAL